MKIQLLSNEPCREDAFEGHSHQHIAEQIVHIIKNDADRTVMARVPAKVLRVKEE